MIVPWGFLAFAAYAGMFYCVWWALRPRFTTVDPDWFYQGGGTWVPSRQEWGRQLQALRATFVSAAEFAEFRQSIQNDRPESKPESGAG